MKLWQMDEGKSYCHPLKEGLKQYGTGIYRLFCFSLKGFTQEETFYDNVLTLKHISLSFIFRTQMKTFLRKSEAFGMT